MKLWTVEQHGGHDVRVADKTGEPVRLVTRVEFDGDGDVGMATVTRYKTDESGGLAVKYADGPIDANGCGRDEFGNTVPPKPELITERMWVQVTSGFQPDKDVATPVVHCQ